MHTVNTLVPIFSVLFCTLLTVLINKFFSILLSNLYLPYLSHSYSMSIVHVQVYVLSPKRHGVRKDILEYVLLTIRGHGGSVYTVC